MAAADAAADDSMYFTGVAWWRSWQHCLQWLDPGGTSHAWGRDRGGGAAVDDSMYFTGAGRRWATSYALQQPGQSKCWRWAAPAPGRHLLVAPTLHLSEPRQLLGVFSQLEEDNLFLIQNCQVGRGRVGECQVSKQRQGPIPDLRLQETV